MPVNINYLSSFYARLVKILTAIGFKPSMWLLVPFDKAFA